MAMSEAERRAMQSDRIRRIACVGLIAALMLPAMGWAQAASSPTSAQVVRVVEANAYVTPEGKLRRSGRVVIENGVIVQVGGERPAGTVVDGYEGGVLCPGLIDCHTGLGVLGPLGEHAAAVQPRVRARDAFNRYSWQLRAALEAGITTFGLVPDDENLVGGRVAVCQTASPEGGARALTDGGPLKLSLAPGVFKVDREPTSRSAALGMLREKLEAVHGGSNSSAERDALRAFAEGRLAGWLTAPSGADVLAGVQLADEYGLRLTLIHTHDARLVAGELGDAVEGVVVGPLGMMAERRDAEAAKRFVEAGVPVALAGGLPHQPADSLRIGACVATRAGLPRAAARRAITSEPAKLLGLGKWIGTIEKGYQADLVVFSGDPLDLRSRVLAVYVGGCRVYVAPATATQGDRP